MGKRITRLPTSVVNHLRSSTNISSVAQIAEELVCNSLDAGATQIEIIVDGGACELKVVDNGHGISRDDLTVVGERHATSKLHSLDQLEGGLSTLGFRGEALSSLCDLALVKITSRCRGTPNTYRKILKGSVTISIGLSGEQRAHGTTVAVRDIFYNQPVRRRILNSSHKKTLQFVKECVLRFVLINPQVSFTVKDLGRKEVVLHSQGAATLSSTLRNVFGEDVFARLQQIDYGKRHLRLAGFLSRSLACNPSKALQYLYINRRHVLKTALHRVLNSWVGPTAYPLGQTGREADKGGKGEVAPRKHLSPVFVLNLTCPTADYDITFDASKSLVEFKDWEPVISFVKAILVRIWGDQLAAKHQTFERSSERSDIRTSLDDRSQQNANVKSGASGKEAIPPMAARRALVQTDSRHRSDHPDLHTKLFPGDRIIPEKSEILTGSPKASAQFSIKSLFGLGRRGERTDVDKLWGCDFQIDDGDGIAPSNSWHTTPCKLRTTPERKAQFNLEEDDESLPSPIVPDFFSPNFDDTQVSFSGNRPLETLDFDDLDVLHGLPPDKDHLTRSASRGRSSSFKSTFSSLNTLWGDSPPHRSVREPVHGDRRTSAALLGDDDSRCLFSPVGGKHVSRDWWKPDDHEQTTRWLCGSSNNESHDGRDWWKPDDSEQKTFWLRGSSDDESHDGAQPAFDTANFLPEVSNLFFPRRRRWAESDRVGPSEADENWMSSSRAKRQRLSNGGDGSKNQGMDQLPSSAFRSFSQDSDYYPSNARIDTSMKYSWDLDFERARAGDKNGLIPFTSTPLLQEADRHLGFSRTGVDIPSAFEDHDFGTDFNAYVPRSKRRLGLTITHKAYDDMEKTGGARQGESEDVLQGSPSHERHPGRRHSGPPFYTPPRRHGAHGNPLNSLSTRPRNGIASNLSGTVQAKADANPEVPMKAPEEINSTRNEPGIEMEWMGLPSTRAGDQGSGKDLPVQDNSCFNQDKVPLCKDRSASVTTEDENLLDLVKYPEPPSLKLDEQLCKYRVSDVNRPGTEGSELPVDTVRAMFKKWSNPCMKKNDDILDLSSGTLASRNSFLPPGAITRDVLKWARVLQQVDTKFIVSVSCGILLLIDQHAADERVRLEEYREAVLRDGNVKKINLLSRSEDLTVTFTEQQALQTYRQQIQDWGWRFKISVSRRPDPRMEGMCKVLLSSVPSILGVSLTGADLTEYLQQLRNTQGSSAPPPAVIRLLNNKACRGAIMFGDTLLPAECNQLVDHLKKTRLCFQCAHGRPTMVPLVDLRGLHKQFDHTTNRSSKATTAGDIGSDQRRKLTVFKGKDGSSGHWHGLRVHIKPSLARAAARLEQARGA